MFNPKTKEIRCCNGFGEVSLVTKVGISGSKSYKIDGKGRSFFYYQLVCGDPVDTYTPFKPAKTPFRFSKEWIGITTDKEAWTFVANEYRNYFGHIEEYTAWDGSIHKGTWKDILQVYADVVHMQRWLGDRVDVHKVLKKFDIE